MPDKEFKIAVLNSVSYKKTQKDNSTGNQETIHEPNEKFSEDMEVIFKKKNEAEIVELKNPSQTLPKN